MLNKVTNFVLNLHKEINSLYRTNEGGRTIRNSRQKKYRNKGKKLILAAKIVAIWYLLILTGSYLTTDTGAYFNDVEVIENSFHAQWDEPTDPPDDGEWGKSSLQEVSIRGTCESGIDSRFTNTGESVNHELTKYEVYWSENDNPKDGEVVKTGTFPIPNKGEYYDIHFKPLKNGRYNIKAYQETGHANSNGEGQGPWSGEIKITDCITTPTTPTTPPAENEDNSNTQPLPEDEDNSNTNPPAESSPLGEITDLSWDFTGSSGKVTIKWKNPSEPNFKYVRVYKEGQDQPFQDNIQNELLDFDKTDTQDTTTYRLVTVDKTGKESTGIKITVSNSNVIVN